MLSENILACNGMTRHGHIFIMLSQLLQRSEEEEKFCSYVNVSVKCGCI